jgi:hypothetical protein
MKSIILILVSLLFILLNCQEKKEVLTNNNKANKMNTTPIYGTCDKRTLWFRSEVIRQR